MSKFIEHYYGANVHILNNHFLSGLLAQLCSDETQQPRINNLVELLYSHLLTEVMNQEFPIIQTSRATRMSSLHPDKQLTYQQIDPNQKVVIVNIARAGTFPSHVCFHNLHFAIDPKNLRQDHIFAARLTDGSNKVTGTEIGATKIGGDKSDSIVIFPDPMGATGNTLKATIEYYKTHVAGTATKLIALHLIVTPEYLKKMQLTHPDVPVYALRLDRGLSDEQVLKMTPGKNWEAEKGLNEKGYIVPGGGGFGEIMNNSYV